jgi:RHS repeat-associated protein
MTLDPMTGRTFAYDGQNQLTSSSLSGVTASLTYDPLGRLYQLSSPSGVRRFLHSTDDSGKPEVISEYDGNNQLTNHYGYGPGPDEPVLWWDGASGFAQRNLQTDERGSIVAVTDASGNPVGINAYDEYGVPAGGSVTGKFGYTGQMWLPEVGLYYYKARMYDPDGVGFVQTDPAGTVDSPNLYEYALDNPVNFTDPTGLDCTDLGPGENGGRKVECKHRGDTLPPGFTDPLLGVDYIIVGQRGLPGLVPGSFSFGPSILNLNGSLGRGVTQQQQKQQNPQRDSCSGLVGQLMSSLYKGGSLTARVGQGSVILGAVLEAGDVTPAAPITAPGGLGLIAFGTLGTTVGAAAQGVAGLYYLAHGNSFPLANAAATFTFGLVHVPNHIAKEGMTDALEAGAEAAERGHEKTCQP